MKKRMHSSVLLMLALVALAAPTAMASEQGSLLDAHPATAVGADTLMEGPTYPLSDFEWLAEVRGREMYTGYDSPVGIDLSAAVGSDTLTEGPIYPLSDFEWLAEIRGREMYTGYDSPAGIDLSAAAGSDAPAEGPIYPLSDFEWLAEVRGREMYIGHDSLAGIDLSAAASPDTLAESPTDPLSDLEWLAEARGREMYTGHDSPAGIDLLATVRQSTVHYQRIEAAQEDGFVPLFECIEHATDGAMGQHYINPDRFDGELHLTQPEALVYEELEDGQFQLVAVEFVIPAAAWSEVEAPALLGQTLKYKTTVGPHEVDPYHQVHVWMYGHNPSGMYADWNPTVDCPS